MHAHTHGSVEGNAAVTQPAGCACRDIASAVRTVDGVDAATVRRRAARDKPDSTTVPAGHEQVMFEATGLDCKTCAALIETVLRAHSGVSNASASHRYGSVRINHDPDEIPTAQLRHRLEDLDYPVESTDEAYETRRAEQWAGVRYAMGVMAGLMVFAPYAGVVWPVRFDAFLDPVVIELLESALASAFASHFYLNLALLSGIVLLFTGGPILSEAETAIRDRRLDSSLVIATSVVGMYLYSTVTAFSGAAGPVYYDVVVAAVVGVTIARQADITLADTSIPTGRAGAVSDTDRDATLEQSD